MCLNASNLIFLFEDETIFLGLQDMGFGAAFLESFFMILVSEAGDETFIIAAIMSMRHNKTIIFTGVTHAPYHHHHHHHHHHDDGVTTYPYSFFVVLVVVLLQAL